MTEKNHAAIYNAEKLWQIEELEKLKARSQIFDKIENDRYLADRYVRRNNPTIMEVKIQIPFQRLKKTGRWIEQEIYQKLET